MFRNVLGRLVTGSASTRGNVNVAAFIQRIGPAAVSVRSCSQAKDETQQPFDTSVLQFLVCPLSKKPLRYEAKTNELINEELGIAYPIVCGIPNMIPQEARLIQKDADTSDTPAQR